MRKMKSKVGFSVSCLLSLSLVVTGIAVCAFTSMAGARGDADPEEGTVSYYAANFFDYESSTRSTETGNWVVGDKEYESDKDLVLFNQENAYVKLGNKPSEHNSWLKETKQKIVEGIVQNKIDSEGKVVLADNRKAVSGTSYVDLFDKLDTKTFIGTYNFPFENIGNGYLQYDSSKNHVNITTDRGQNGILDMFRSEDGEVSSKGFMPFNKLNTAKGADENGYYNLVGNSNYYFGMSLDLPFYMTEDGKITTNEGTKEDMTFEFSGDDDIWVFVDGKLVLDLGGVHDAVDGSINFATAQVSTTGNHYNAETGKYSIKTSRKVDVNTYLQSLSEGKHTLQVFFLERGGEKSQCKITFRLQDKKEVVETKKPVVTETPVVTEAPVVTEKPVETKAPVVTETPVVTEAPVVTKTPVATLEPTKEPFNPTQPTVEPVTTTTPVITVAPEATVKPVATKAAATKKPAVVKIDPNNTPKTTNNKTTTLVSDNKTPLAILPQTGTVAESVFYGIGILLIAGGLFVGVYFRKAKAE